MKAGRDGGVVEVTAPAADVAVKIEDADQCSGERAGTGPLKRGRRDGGAGGEAVVLKPGASLPVSAVCHTLLSCIV